MSLKTTFKVFVILFLPALLLAQVEIKLSDSLAYDINGNMIANPGDSILYRGYIKNRSGQKLTGNILNRTIDPNTTYDPATFIASPIAINDTLPFISNPLSQGVPGVLMNDFDLNDPAPNPNYFDNLTVFEVMGSTANVGISTATMGGGQILLNSNGAFTYDTTGINGATSDTFTYTILDNDGYFDTAKVFIILNMAPVISSNLMATDSICAFEQQDTQIVTTAFTIMDDGVFITMATIQICQGYISTEDTLVAGSLPGGIIGSWNDMSGMLTLTGSTSLANYEAAIEGIQYINSSNIPAQSPRRICITVNDGSVLSNTIIRGLKIVPFNDCPTAVRDTFAVTENSAFPMSNVLTNDFDPDLDVLTAIPIVNLSVSGGTVNLLANGSFSFVHTTGNTGLDTLNVGEMFFARSLYSITDGLCMDNDSVIVKITGINDAPIAVDNNYSTNQSTILSIPAPGILGNDVDIDHNSIISVVQVQGGANIGTNIVLTSGATVNVSSNGSFTYNPNCVASGLDSFTYVITDENGAMSNIAKVYISVSQSIWFVDDVMTNGVGSFSAPFNTLAGAQSASGPGDYIYVFPGTYTSGITLKNNQKLIGSSENWVCPSGSNIRNASGSSDILSGVILAQSDTLLGLNFGNGSSVTGSAVANLKMNNINVNKTTGAGDFMGISTSGNLDINITTFIVSAGENALQLVGCTGTTTLSGVNVTGGSGPPVLIQGGSVNLTATGTLITQTNNVALMTVDGGHNGTVTMNLPMSATNGTGLQFDNADGAYSFPMSVTLNGGDAGIDLLNGSTGTFTFTSTTITNPSGTGFNLNASNANVTYSGNINDNTGFAIDINNHDGGTMTFNTGTISATGTGLRVQESSAGTINFNNSTKAVSTGTNPGVTLINNNGSTINFGGGGLAISTTTGIGLNATGGGTINVTGTGNTITSTTGTALNVVNTTIGSSNLNFQSISSNGGTAPGIILNTTGTSGGLNVSGDGSNVVKGGNASGGTIANKMDGGTNDNPTVGTGIYLNNTSNVVLRRMQINDCGNSGIRGLSVGSFTFQYGTINGVNGNTNVGTEGCIGFGTSNPGGANGFLNGAVVLIDNAKIKGGVEHNIEFYNQSNSFSATISNCDITDNSIGLGADGIQIEMQGTASANFSVQSCFFDNNKSQPVQAAANDNSFIDITINNCTVQKTSQGNEGFILSNGSNGDLTTHITNNVISGVGGAAIFVGQTPGNATAASNLIAVISGNTISHPSTATNHAIIAYLTSTVGQVSTANILIQNNTITENSIGGTSRPIEVNTTDAGTSPSFSVSVIGNSAMVTDNVGGSGIQVAARQLSAGCFDIRNNTVTFPNGTPGGVFGLRARQANSATVNLEQGSSAGIASVVLAANNPASTTEILGTVNVVGNATCLTAPSIIENAKKN